MKTKSLGILLVMVFAFVASIAAQVPSMLNYQGRIAVNGVNFSGTGQFKFALINTSGSQSFWSNDGTSSAGSQPKAIPARMGPTIGPAAAMAEKCWFSNGPASHGT